MLERDSWNSLYGSAPARPLIPRLNQHRETAQISTNDVNLPRRHPARAAGPTERGFSPLHSSDHPSEGDANLLEVLDNNPNAWNDLFEQYKKLVAPIAPRVIQRSLTHSPTPLAQRNEEIVV